MSSWRNVPGRLIIELGLDDESNLIDLSSEKSLDLLRPFVPDPERSEIVINFLSSGFYEKSSMYGGPHNLGWPAEGEEDREFDSTEILTNGLTCGILPPEVGQRLFELYESEINDVEIDVSFGDSYE